MYPIDDGRIIDEDKILSDAYLDRACVQYAYICVDVIRSVSRDAHVLRTATNADPLKKAASRSKRAMTKIQNTSPELRSPRNATIAKSFVVIIDALYTMGQVLHENHLYHHCSRLMSIRKALDSFCDDPLCSLEILGQRMERRGEKRHPYITPSFGFQAKPYIHDAAKAVIANRQSTELRLGGSKPASPPPPPPATARA